ncbi:MAG: hypothetical protein LJE69_05135 [Thiohalocapsa sp.]|jgi:hypothetical protein|uniref:hypothetical protein n=1 Tax=Thiohalocapsa sp. TaxID=2497641 RepID=UPI0025D7AD0C|nr:hypothetical protein [Thiohalocapsa sp.]MCG6940616.1 hypothetical protein [Thiohalocapsa sp.]
MSAIDQNRHRLIPHQRFQEACSQAAGPKATWKTSPALAESMPLAAPPTQSNAPPLRRPKHSRRWSVERSRTVRRYRLAVMALVVAGSWTGAFAYSLWHQGLRLNRELAAARDDLRSALSTLRELGIQRPAGAVTYRSYTPIHLHRNPLQDVTFLPAENGQSIETRLTLFNGTAKRLEPRPTVTLYNRIGLPLGEAQVGLETPAEVLHPGKTSTYHLQIPLSRAAEPAWFEVAAGAP